MSIVESMHDLGFNLYLTCDIKGQVLLMFHGMKSSQLTTSCGLVFMFMLLCLEISFYLLDFKAVVEGANFDI
jgi:hypothetical protein